MSFVKRLAKPSSFLVLLVAFVAFIPSLGSFGIMDPSDGLYAESAREMVDSGDYLTPSFNYSPFFEKPILIYWLIALSYRVFGVSEFAARLPAAAAAIFTVGFLYLTIGSVFSRRAALFSCLVLISNALFAVIGHLALTDMPLTCLATIAALSFFCATENDIDQLKRDVFLLISYCCLGLSCLLKGPIIIIITLFALFLNKLLLNKMVAGAAAESYFLYFLRLKPLLGCFLIFILDLPWFLAEHIATHGAFTREFFLRQNFGRFAGVVNHLEPWWFYLPYLAASFMPWMLFMPLVIPKLKSAWLTRMHSSNKIRLVIFCLSWTIVCVALLSAVATKLPPYILPALPLASVLLGIALDRGCYSVKEREQSERLIVNGAWSIGLISFLSSIILLVALASNQLVLPEAPGFIGSSVALAAASVCYALMRRSQPESALVIFAWGLCLSSFFAVPAGLICYYRVKQSDFKQLVIESRGSNLATFWRDTTAGVFYHRKKVTLVRTISDLDLFLTTPGKPHLIIVTEDLIPFLRLEMRDPNLKFLVRKGKFALFNLDKR